VESDRRKRDVETSEGERDLQEKDPSKRREWLELHEPSARSRVDEEGMGAVGVEVDGEKGERATQVEDRKDFRKGGCKEQGTEGMREEGTRRRQQQRRLDRKG
jgi:hypothetical protein